MNLATLLTVVTTAAACATSPLDGGGTTPTAAPRVPAAPILRTPIDPALPGVERLGRSVFTSPGELAIADLDLCVSPGGRVPSVVLARGTGYWAFDAAVVRDAKAWRFATLPGPETVETCRRVQVRVR